jgi:phytanoyl-CoA dioxygenase PhyH
MQTWAQALRTLNGVRHIASTRGRLALERLRASPLEASEWYRVLRQRGIVVVPGFYTRLQCERAIEEFERLRRAYPEHVHVRSDRRLFAANRASRVIGEFADHPRLVTLAREFYARPAVSCITLAAHLPFSASNGGSGEGWHRDSHRPQFKSILYLTDVSEQTGPFQLVPGSHRTVDMLIDTAFERLEPRHTRLTDGQVASIVRRRYPRGVDTLTGAAGTLILVNTSAIHRGKPIERGERYALTNYYYGEVPLPEKMERHFSPLLPFVPAEPSVASEARVAPPASEAR